MLDNLTNRFSNVLKNIRGQAKLTEDNIKEALREVRLALLEADVALSVVKEFVNNVKEKALGQEVAGSLTPDQAFIGVVNQALIELMGKENKTLDLSVAPPAVVLMAGLQGAGKTTTVGKLARLLKNEQKKKVLVVSADVYRPAAIEQLRVLAEQIEVPIFMNLEEKDPVKIALAAIQEAKAKSYDTVIVDTAGRLAIDEALMNEIAAVKAATSPDETLFVVDAMTGQDAVNTAKEFNSRLDFDGVVLTKLDGDTRGGAALSIRAVVDKPIKFVGTGEKMEALDVFHPDRMADRILGMGDIVSLVERAQEQYDEAEARKLQRKIQKNQFDFNDFLAQLQQIKKMGNIKDLAAMIPGVGKAIKDVDVDDSALLGVEAIILSMTPYERRHPEVLNASRKTRIAKGSGKTVQDVNRLLKQFDQTRKMMKMVSGNGLRQMMSRMPGLPGMPKA